MGWAKLYRLQVDRWKQAGRKPLAACHEWLRRAKTQGKGGVATEPVESLTPDSYMRWTRTTAVYPTARAYDYLLHGLMSEVGELAAMRKRELRDGTLTNRQDVLHELGDILWYVARLTDIHGMRLSEVMDANRKKLSRRQSRGTLHGKGDHR